MMRPNWRSASSIPAAVQRTHISPDCQCLTLRTLRRTISIIDSQGLVSPDETARMLAVTLDRLDVLDVRVGEYGATVRDRGIREQTRSGRPVLFDGLRARVSRWPPLRLARMRRERESVGVVCPPVSLHVQRCRR